MYTIGQIANILGISRDKLRYYEEKGILIPKQNSENNYRLYDIKDIDTVLQIEFYRSMDLDFKTIDKLHKQGSVKIIEGTLEKKQNLVSREIDRLTSILRRIESIRKGCADIENYLDKFTVRPMEPVKIIGEISDFRAYDEFDTIHQNRSDLEDSSIIKSLKRYLKFGELGLESTKMLITKEIESDDEDEAHDVLGYEKCAYTVVEDGLHKQNVMEETFSRSLEWIEKNNFTHMGIAILGMLLMTSEKGLNKSYLEVYIPIK